MRILVTVGTTPFDSLVHAVDKLSLPNVLIQHASKTIIGLSSENIDFICDIGSEYERADLIITHAGAGSVYKLLELGKNLIVVPNLERIDSHQKELAKYVEDNDYALVLWDLHNLVGVLKKSESFVYKKYQSEAFFKFNEIANLLNK